MSYSNDEIEAARRRLLDSTHDTTLDVYEASESYDVGEGFDPDYPASPSQTGIEALDTDPAATADREQRGTSADLDRVFVVRDDVRASWTGFENSGDAPLQVEDTETGVRYQVQSVVDGKDGRIRLQCVEV